MIGTLRIMGLKLNENAYIKCGVTSKECMIEIGYSGSYGEGACNPAHDSGWHATGVDMTSNSVAIVTNCVNNRVLQIT